jgi:hypothetical protein
MEKIGSHEFERLWKKMAMGKFEVLSWKLREETKGNY